MSSLFITNLICINQQMSHAKLELCCKDKKVTVNFNNYMRVIPKTVDSEFLKKNSSTPQLARLERRAETRADEARVETKKQQNIAADANIETGKQPLILNKLHHL